MNKLSLNKTTLLSLTVRTAVKTGMGAVGRPQTHTCITYPGVSLPNGQIAGR